MLIKIKEIKDADGTILICGIHEAYDIQGNKCQPYKIIRELDDNFIYYYYFDEIFLIIRENDFFFTTPLPDIKEELHAALNDIVFNQDKKKYVEKLVSLIFDKGV
jgi:hypothetical protein